MIADLYLQDITNISTATSIQSDDISSDLLKLMQEDNEALRNEIQKTNALLYKVVEELQATRNEIAVIRENQLQTPTVNMLPMPEDTLEAETDQSKKKWWQRLLS